MPRKNTESNVWEQVQIGRADECWPWTGAHHTKPHGLKYGRICWNNKDTRVHRLVYFFKTGEFPTVVRHKCDNSLCCNPDHLIGGTHKDNMRDMAVRGRAYKPKGELHHHAKLTAEAVRIIRDRYSKKEDIWDIAKSFGISPYYVHQVALKKRWKHVT